jgi:hypothetical protein
MHTLALRALLWPALLSATLLPCPARGAEDTPRGKKYALLVGVKEYRHSKFPNLKYTENDVEALAGILAKKDAGFAAVTSLTTTRGKRAATARPTAANVRAALRQFMAGRGKHDTLLVALSGHGMHIKGKKGKGKDQSYFCPSDADPRDPRTLIGLTGLMDDLDACGAGVKLLLVDACRNEVDGEKSLEVDSIKPARGIAVLFSCSAGQKSHETAKLGKGHGLFFHYVLQGLNGGACPSDSDEVTWDDLVAYVKRQVPRAALKVIGDGAQQSPHLVSNLVNTPLLVRVPGGGRVGKKPHEGETKLEAVGRTPKVVSWLRANTRIKPADLPKWDKKISHTAETYNGLTVSLGARVMKSGQACCLVMWAGEFYAFPLSPRQAARLKLRDTGAQYAPRAKGLDERVTPAEVTLGKVTFTGGTKLDSTSRLTGEVHCEVKTPPRKKVALRLSYSLGESTVDRFYPLEAVHKTTKRLHFSFPAIDARAASGPVVLFLGVCRVRPEGEKGPWTLVSNTQAALLDVAESED